MTARTAPAVCLPLLLLAAIPGQGQTRDPATARLPEVEVIARPYSPGLDTSQVIQADELESARVLHLAAALDLLPGVTITRLGQRNEALVNVRGFDSRQVPLFIDGIPIYVPYDGNLDLSRLGIRDVDTIRVTRAGGSVLYGANAMGGAINVLTRRPAEPGLSLDGRLAITLDDRMDGARQEAGALAAWAGDAWYGQFSSFLQDTDFFRLSGDAGPFGPGEDGGRRNNSASRDVTTSVRLGRVAESGADRQVVYTRLDGSKESPPYAGTAPGVQTRFWRWPEYDTQNVYLIGAVPVAESLWLRTRAFYGTFQNTLLSFDDDTYTTQTRNYAFTSTYDDYTWGGSAELERAHGGQAVTRAIAHYKRDVHRETDNAGQPEERQEDANWSVAVEHERRLTATWRGVVGAGLSGLDARRADNNTGGGIIEPFPVEDETAVNARLGLAWEVAPDQTLGLNVARKTRFPTLKDRFSYRLGRAIPNPALNEETADHVELSFRGVAYGTSLEMAVYGAWIDDAIEAVSIAPDLCTTPPCSQNQNIGRQRNRGLDVFAARALPVIGELRLVYGYLDRDNRSNPAVLPVYTPRHSGRLSTRTTLTQKLSLTADLRAESGRNSQTNGARQTAGFGLIGAGLVAQLTPALQLLVEVDNLTDRDYALEEGFPEAGRSYLLSARWQPR